MKFTDRYQFNSQTDLIGKGGFSKVYKAYDTIRKRTVALKFYQGSVSDKYDIISEINRMEDAVHPNLIRYYDADIIESVNAIGVVEQIQVGIMEYANAGDISLFFKKQQSIPTIHTLVLDILQGLKYLHENDIAHRDLKPKNILLSKKRGKFVAKIADFGISKRIGLDNSGVSSQLLGSVEYMSPEQFAPSIYGIDGQLNTNVDLWSFGVIVYEMFARQLPFGSRTQGINYEQILNNILFNELNIDYSILPEPYRELVARCMVKKAYQRAQTADELIAILKGESVTPTINNSLKEDSVTPADNEQASFNNETQEPKDIKQGIKTSIFPNPFRTKITTKNEEEDTSNSDHTSHYPTTPFIDFTAANDDYKTTIHPKTDKNSSTTEAFTQPKTPNVRKQPVVARSSQGILHELNVGKNLFKLGNYVDSFRILDLYTDKKEFDTEAKFYLGYMYYNGKCGGAHDPKKGKQLMNEAKRENRPLVLDLMVKYVLNRS